MKKLFLLLLITSFTFLEAKMIDGIAMIVEGEPITTAEIRAVRSQMRISKKDAVDLLIQDRLQTISMKDIIIHEDKVDNKIAQIAKQNRLTIPKMQKILKRQGTSWIKYRKNIRESLKKSLFYQNVVVASIPEPSEDQLKLFYKKHVKSFTIPKTIKMIEYSAKSEKILKILIKKHRAKGSLSKYIRKDTKSLTLEMLSIFLQTRKNHYTKIFNAGDKYITYKILSTIGKRTMSFESAKNAITVKWKQSQQETVLKDYFKKLRTRADIQILR